MEKHPESSAFGVFLSPAVKNLKDLLPYCNLPGIGKSCIIKTEQYG